MARPVHGVPAAVVTVRRQLVVRLGQPICGVWRLSGPPGAGVLAYDVCARWPHHDRPHRGAGGVEWWLDELLEPAAADPGDGS